MYVSLVLLTNLNYLSCLVRIILVGQEIGKDLGLGETSIGLGETLLSLGETLHGRNSLWAKLASSVIIIYYVHTSVFIWSFKIGD